jgi:hypothetical protein
MRVFALVVAALAFSGCGGDDDLNDRPHSSRCVEYEQIICNRSCEDPTQVPQICNEDGGYWDCPPGTVKLGHCGPAEQ